MGASSSAEAAVAVVPDVVKSSSGSSAQKCPVDHGKMKSAQIQSAVTQNTTQYPSECPMHQAQQSQMSYVSECPMRQGANPGGNTPNSDIDPTNMVRIIGLTFLQDIYYNDYYIGLDHRFFLVMFSSGGGTRIKFEN